VAENCTQKLKCDMYVKVLWILLQLAFSCKCFNPGKLIGNDTYSRL